MDVGWIAHLWVACPWQVHWRKPSSPHPTSMHLPVPEFMIWNVLSWLTLKRHFAVFLVAGRPESSVTIRAPSLVEAPSTSMFLPLMATKLRQSRLEEVNVHVAA